MNRVTLSLERFSLTPALSRWERGNYSQVVGNGNDQSRFIVPMHAKKLETGLFVNRNVRASCLARLTN
jgi:hypothetical protein